MSDIAPKTKALEMLQDAPHGHSAFRIDTEIHDALMQPVTGRRITPSDVPQTLPEPVFPQHKGQNRSKLGYHLYSGYRAFQTWIVPYLRSRLQEDELKPLLAYLYTEYKCNLDCHYCWAFNNKIKGMTEDTAKRAIDWLHGLGCRVLALMGGEPLLRPDFVHKVIYYGTQRGFFVYLPTNGRLMRPHIIDRIGDAGVATVNLAIDCIEEKPGLPKSLSKIRGNFDYLVKMQQKYGYMIVLNINICHNNIDDVKELTEIAYQNGISTDYHINESPLMTHENFQHLENNETFLTPDDYSKVDALIDYLIDKIDQGYIMVNSKAHLSDMRDFMHGKFNPWTCRAGINTLFIRHDGSLSPCFAMYHANHDWGSIEEPHFEREQLDTMKVSCTKHCLSTCNYIVGHYYKDTRVAIWMTKQLLHGYQGKQTTMLSQS